MTGLLVNNPFKPNWETDLHPDSTLFFPYQQDVTDSERRRRDVDCKLYSYGKMSNVKLRGHTNHTDTGTVQLPIVETHHTMQTIRDTYWNERNVRMHVTYVSNPVETVSVYEPIRDGTCYTEHLEPATVEHSAHARNCLVAVNAGFFNTTSGECLGNIVSDGMLVQDSEGVQNAHFGITRDGSLFFGYLSEIDLVAEDFLQLVGGVVWILKDGEVYVDESIVSECADTETTGTLQRFASVVSARTVVGHDADGRLIILQIDGKTNADGASLEDAAQMMKTFGAVNAVNLDGGGSSTMVINGTLVNYPSDVCKDDERFHCARNVTTILCVHEPRCDPQDCSGHGSCDLGVCRCQGYWSGSRCDRLKCLKSCSGHGNCTEDGCFCDRGYHGDSCGSTCTDGWYGYQCKQRCYCENGAPCDHVTGMCRCPPGYSGSVCQHACEYGYFGANCSRECRCDEGCGCDHLTGNCNYTRSQQQLHIAGTCLTEQIVREEKLESDMMLEYKKSIASVIALAVISAISLAINLVLSWKYCTKWRHKPGTRAKYSRAPLHNGHTYVFQNQRYSSFTTSSSEDIVETSFINGTNRQRVS